MKSCVFNGIPIIETMAGKNKKQEPSKPLEVYTLRETVKSLEWLKRKIKRDFRDEYDHWKSFYRTSPTIKQIGITFADQDCKAIYDRIIKTIDQHIEMTQSRANRLQSEIMAEKADKPVET